MAALARLFYPTKESMEPNDIKLNMNVECIKAFNGMRVGDTATVSEIMDAGVIKVYGQACGETGYCAEHRFFEHLRVID